MNTVTPEALRAASTLLDERIVDDPESYSDLIVVVDVLRDMAHALRLSERAQTTQPEHLGAWPDTLRTSMDRQLAVINEGGLSDLQVYNLGIATGSLVRYVIEEL